MIACGMPARLEAEHSELLGAGIWRSNKAKGAAGKSVARAELPDRFRVQGFALEISIVRLRVSAQSCAGPCRVRVASCK